VFFRNGALASVHQSPQPECFERRFLSTAVIYQKRSFSKRGYEKRGLKPLLLFDALVGMSAIAQRPTRLESRVLLAL
jgi:hypothetical protein